jgi:hypothetical protein
MRKHNFPLSVLITNHNLTEYAGSEINAYTLAQYFQDCGVNVVIGTFNCENPMKDLCKDRNINVVNLLNDSFNFSQVDLIWAHHSPTLYSCIFEHKIIAKYIIFSSLSPNEPLEALPTIANKLSCVLANSEETRDKLQSEYNSIKNLYVFPNYATNEMFLLVPTSSYRLNKIAIISNHVPTELLDFKEIVEEKFNISVDIFGIGFQRKLVNEALLHTYDLIISIGKTVQYAMASMVPIYCYDHFGGPGWLNEKNIRLAEYYNFSGRGFNNKLTGIQLVNDILGGYDANLHDLKQLRNYAMKRFNLTNNINQLLKLIYQEQPINMDALTKYSYLLRHNQSYTKILETHYNLIQSYNGLLSDKKQISLSLSKMQLAVIDKKQKKVLFGSGEGSKIVYKYFIRKIDYFVDNNFEKWGSKIENIVIYNPKKLIEEDKDKLAIIIASQYYEEISEQLKLWGFKENEHFWNGIWLSSILDELNEINP